MRVKNHYFIVIPTFNEEANIGTLLDHITRTNSSEIKIIVVDGLSTDRTRELVLEKQEEHPNIQLLTNPNRTQSWAVNLAVSEFGESADYFIRVDAHAAYPDDYFISLMSEANKMDADSVVVSMITKGQGFIQSSNAIAQNSKLGNGGSAHRSLANGKWVDHGHHALFKVKAFQKVGGYDVTFRANEDAELDHRLNKAGFKIWLTAETSLDYFPRKTFSSLFKQYLNYGRGRAMNITKHRVIPKIRQMLPLAIFPIVLLSALSFITWLAALPALGWVMTCLGLGFMLSYTQGHKIFLGMGVGVSAMTMHFAWSLGFWAEIISILFRAGERRK